LATSSIVELRLLTRARLQWFDDFATVGIGLPAAEADL
jgi:hypothetical protein